MLLTVQLGVFSWDLNGWDQGQHLLNSNWKYSYKFNTHFIVKNKQTYFLGLWTEKSGNSDLNVSSP